MKLYHVSDTSERQCIKDMDGIPKRAKIRLCSISDPFILVLREDDTLGLFVGDAEKGRIRRKDMTPMGEKASRIHQLPRYLGLSPFYPRHRITLVLVFSKTRAVSLNLV